MRAFCFETLPVRSWLSAVAVGSFSLFSSRFASLSLSLGNGRVINYLHEVASYTYIHTPYVEPFYPRA